MKYGFIGCGNMGGAIAKAISAQTDDLAVTDRSGRAKALGLPYVTAEEIAKTADRIFLAVKPQMMAGVLENLKPLLQARKPLLITMAAGLTMEKIDSLAGGGYPVIRIMPNTPARVGSGVILYDANDRVRKEDLEEFLAAIAPAGLIDPLPERLIDAGSAVAGCGPAFACQFMEALADGGVACGLPRAKAMEYAAQMLLGTAKLLLESGEHPGSLKDAVCSPGGSTIQGVRALEQGGFRGTVMEAVIAAWEKNQELGK